MRVADLSQRCRVNEIDVPLNERGREDERAAIVSWLLREEAELLTPAPFYRTAAKGIERGEHLAGDDA